MHAWYWRPFVVSRSRSKYLNFSTKFSYHRQVSLKWTPGHYVMFSSSIRKYKYVMFRHGYAPLFSLFQLQCWCLWNTIVRFHVLYYNRLCWQWHWQVSLKAYKTAAQPVLCYKCICKHGTWVPSQLTISSLLWERNLPTLNLYIAMGSRVT